MFNRSSVPNINRQIQLLVLLAIGLLGMSTIGCDDAKLPPLEEREPYQIGLRAGYARIKWETETLGPVFYSSLDMVSKSQGYSSTADRAVLGRMEDRRQFLVTVRNNQFAKGFNAYYVQDYLLGFNEGINQYIRETSGRCGMIRHDLIDIRALDVPVRVF